MKRDTLDGYVRRVLHEKGLTGLDVERRSEGAISDSYVSEIARGKIKNLTMQKLVALARGLGVPEAQLVIVACGISLSNEVEQNDFALLAAKYKQLPEKDRQELSSILEMLNHEIERRIRLFTEWHG